MQHGREVVIVEAVRTPIGRGHPERGWFRDIHPANLLARTYRGLFERSGIDPAVVDDVIAGCVTQLGTQGFNVARNAWLREGLPMETPATTLDRQCGSAQTAVNFAASLIASGVHDVVIGCGVEHMGSLSFAVHADSQQRYGAAMTDELLERYPITNQGLGAELIAAERGITRREQEEFAVRSHERAAAATDEGRFRREIVPVSVNGSDYRRDQGIRPETSVETLAALKPAFKPDGTITAGTSSQVSDGAAAVLLMAREKAEELGVSPRARIIDHLTVGCDPVKMLEGPIPATEKILSRNGMAIGDLDRIEVNEAFAPVVLAWERAHEPDMDRVNVRGGAIALGHPLGSSGARLITTLLHILEDEDQATGLVTMCCGGGLGTATLLERL